MFVRSNVSADVTFLEDTFYFSSSSLESNTIFEVLHVPYFGPPHALQESISPMISKESSVEQTQVEPSPPPLITYQCRRRTTIPVVEEVDNPEEVS